VLAEFFENAKRAFPALVGRHNSADDYAATEWHRLNSMLQFKRSATLDRKVDMMDNKIDALEKKMDNKIDALEKRMDARMDRLEKKMDSMLESMKDILAALRSLAKRRNNVVRVWLSV